MGSAGAPRSSPKTRGPCEDCGYTMCIAADPAAAVPGVAVPVYPTNSPHECKWVAGDSGARAIVCEDEGQRQKIDQIRDELTDLEHVIGIEPGAGDMTLDELRERGGGGEGSELS